MDSSYDPNEYRRQRCKAVLEQAATAKTLAAIADEASLIAAVMLLAGAIEELVKFHNY